MYICSNYSAMTKEQAQKGYTDELRKFQEETIFPSELIPLDFTKWIDRAFRFVTPSRLKVSAEQYRKYITMASPDTYTIDRMGVLLDVLTQCHAENMGMEWEEYLAFCEDIEKMVQKYTEIVEPEATSIRRKYEALVNLQQKTPGKTIPMPTAKA